MNWDRFEGNCRQIGGIVKEQLAGSPMIHSASSRVSAISSPAKIRTLRVAKEEAARQLREFYARNRNWDPSRQ